MEFPEIVRTLMQNSDKNFVQRILNPDVFPVMDLGDGNVATHKMAYGEKDGKFIVLAPFWSFIKKLK